MDTVPHEVCVAHSFSLKIGHFVLQYHPRQPYYSAGAVLQRSDVHGPARLKCRGLGLA